MNNSIRKLLNEKLNTLLVKKTLLDYTKGKMYHFTKSEYLDDIKKQGLIPRKNPNNHYGVGGVYEGGCNGVFLSPNMRVTHTNLPADIHDAFEEWYYSYDSDEDREEDGWEYNPIIMLTINIKGLDFSKFFPDDDYLTISKNKNIALDIKIIESLKWGSLCYSGIIPPNLIINATNKFQF